jgi:glutathione synthase/RimK-type ligase-like ATP-grasp enzyme
MEIAIHRSPGSFSDRWILYCKENRIPYKLVNCYDSDIIAQLDNYKALMWHWNQNDYRTALIARQLTIALEKKGIKVFPDVNTAWHYNDKLGQKYLLEAIDAPFVKSYIFYSKKEALNWVNKTTFPKVFKLRCGAASENVSLAKTKKRARLLIEKAFGIGFLSVNRFSRLADHYRSLRRDKNLAAIRRFVSCFIRMFIPSTDERLSPNEMGYVYFQDFVPENKYDTRLVVIGDRCFGVRRYCRKGDFRASGSGIKAYGPELFDKKSIQIAFEIAKKLKTQCIAFDFLRDGQQSKIIEMSYCFVMGSFYDNCPGYWDSDLNWHEENINPQYFMIEDFLEEVGVHCKILRSV